MIGEMYGSEDLHIEETIVLRSYLHKKFWIKKVKNNSRGHLGDKKDFLK